jgi:hypothetical protein
MQGDPGVCSQGGAGQASSRKCGQKAGEASSRHVTAAAGPATVTGERRDPRPSVRPRAHQQALHVDGVPAAAADGLFRRVHEKAGQSTRRPLLTHAAERAARAPRAPRALPPSPTRSSAAPSHTLPAPGTERVRGLLGDAARLGRPVRRPTRRGQPSPSAPEGRREGTRVTRRAQDAEPAIFPHAQCAAHLRMRATSGRALPKLWSWPAAGGRESRRVDLRSGWRGKWKRWSRGSEGKGNGQRSGGGGHSGRLGSLDAEHAGMLMDSWLLLTRSPDVDA